MTATSPQWPNSSPVGRARAHSSSRPPRSGIAFPYRSSLRVQQPPGHGADLVKELQRRADACELDRTGVNEQPEMAVHLLRGAVGDAPVVYPVAAGSPMPLGKIGGDRRCRPDHLIGKTLQRSGYPLDDPEVIVEAFPEQRSTPAIRGRGSIQRQAAGVAPVGWTMELITVPDCCHCSLSLVAARAYSPSALPEVTRGLPAPPFGLRRDKPAAVTCRHQRVAFLRSKSPRRCRAPARGQRRSS